MSLFSKGALCKRCSTPFAFRDCHLGPRSHIANRTPILLNCGHNICEFCARSLLKTRREIPCPHCEAITSSQPGKTNVEDLPVDKYTLGSLLLQKKFCNKPSYRMQINIPNPQAENSLNASQDQCTDCDKYTATLYCVNCISNMCHDCFMKAHKDSTSLGRHKVHHIERQRRSIKSDVCQFHNEIVEFFCNNDDMKVCKSCLQPTGKHSNHDVIQLSEKNKDAMEEVLRGSEHVKNMCTHLFIAEKRLKDYLPQVKTKSQTDTDKLQNAFMLAHGILQNREITLTTFVTRDMEDSEKSINHLLEEVEETSKKLKELLCDIECLKADNSLSKIDDIVTEMNSVKELPCHLEDIAIEKESSVQFDETSMRHLQEFGTILNLDDDRWKLCTIKEGARPQGISEDELHDAEKNSVPAAKMATMTAKAYIETHTNNTEVAEVMPARKTFSESPASDCGNRLQFKRRHDFGGSSSRSESDSVPYSPVQRSPPSPSRPVKWKYLQQELVILSHSTYPSDFWVRLSSKQHIFQCFHKQIDDYMLRTHEPCPEEDVIIGQMYLAQRGKENRWCRVRVQDIMEASSVTKPNVGDKGAHIEKAIADDEEMNDCGDGDSDATVEFNEANIEATPPHEPAQPQCESGLVVKVFQIDFGSIEKIPISGLRKIPQQFSEQAEFVIHCELAEIGGIHGFWTPDANPFFECYCGQGTLMMTVIHTSDMKVEVELGHMPQDKFNDTPGSARETLIFHELAKYTCDSPKFMDRTKIKKYYRKTQLPSLGTNSNVNVHCVKSPEDIYVQQEGSEHDRFVKMMAAINTFYENLADGDSWVVYNPKIGMPCIAKCENGIWNRAVIENLPGHQQLDVVFVDFGNSKRIMSNMARRMNSDFMKLPTHALHCGLVDIKPKSGSCWSQEARTNLTQLVDGKLFRMSVIGISDDKLDVCLLHHIPEYQQVLSLSSQLVKLGHALSSGNSADRVISAYKQELGITAKNKDSACPGDYIPVTVCFVKDPSEIYVQCDERKEQLEEMVTKLQEWYSEGQSTVPSDYKWEIGQQCVVRNQFKWFRCVIKQMKFANLFEVWAMDYGHCIDATRENTRMMAEDFQDDHAFACKCHLANISPTGGNNKWTVSAVNYVKERFNSDLNVFLRVEGPTVEDSEPVDLYVKKVEFGGALEPTKVLYMSTREAIVEAGLAMPRRRVKVEPGTEPVVTIPVVLQKQVIVKAEPQKKVENWLAPVQPNRILGKCTVIPTHVDEEGVIYLHNEDEVDQMNLIKSAMASKYQDVTPEQDDDICWSKDECCAVFLDRDGNWHRGRVVDVKPEGLEVFFIDYGYRETLKAEHLRKEIILTYIPQLCWPCKLYGIEPKTDDAMWPETTIEYISQIIINQRCEMEIWIPPKGKDLMEITLKLPSNEDLGELLLSKDYVFFHDPDTDCVPEDMDTSIDETPNTEVPRVDVMFNAFPELMLPPVGEVFQIAAVDVGVTPDLFLMQRAYMELPQTEYQQQAKEHYLFTDKMCKTLNEQAPSWPVVENVQPGTPCCTMYSLDGHWFRAVVLRLQEASMCLVLFVDYGNEEIVSTKDIKVLPKEFLDFPRQCICCKLHQVVPTAEEGWTEDVSQKFHTLWTDPPPTLLAHVKVSRYPIEVDILCYDQDGNECLAYQHLIDMGLVRQCQT